MHTLKAKYQLRKNLFASCHLEVDDISESALKVYVGVKAPADTKLPMGTKIIIDPSSMPNSKLDISKASFEVLSSRVLEHQEGLSNIAPLHVCTAIDRTERENKRTVGRQNCQFLMKTGNLELKVINGNLNGLGLVLQADRMFSSLTQGRDYPLITQFNGQDYEFTGTVCHMQYNWQTLIHRIGVTLHPMDKEHETVLSKLIDPNFTIALKHGEVDTTAGKIST